MAKTFIFSLLGILIGVVIGYMLIFRTPNETIHLSVLFEKKHEIIGFLPYWLLNKTKKDYSSYLTTVAYFGLTVEEDGSIQKLANVQEENPGWHALRSGRLDEIFSNAKKDNIKLSLVVFNGDNESIGKLISDPIPHAQNLIKEIEPVMRKYGFSDLNLDIENTTDNASDEARLHFIQFVSEIKKQIDSRQIGTLSLDASPIVLIKKYLIDVSQVAPFVNNLVLMTYDFHYQGSSVTGPVSPLNGAGIDEEFDSSVAINQALNSIPREKLIMGIPLYGYEWETLDSSPHSAIIPGTGIVASNMRVESLLKNCASCSAQLDQETHEAFLSFKDEETGTYHQIFYPNKESTAAKIQLTEKNRLGGVALWALGYEGETILDPVKEYKQ